MQSSAARRGIDLQVTGFGAAFALHFTQRSALWDYRDTFDDDRELLSEFLRSALEQGLYLLPDGRFYVSAAHSEDDIEEAISAIDRVFDQLAATQSGSSENPALTSRK